MSTRERWIIYPLLFLTLGIAMRDKVTGHIGSPWGQVQVAEVKARSVRCNELVVSGPNGRPVVIAGASPVNGSGVVKILSANGFPQVQLGSSDTGGIVETIGHFGRLLVSLGHLGNGFGVLAELPEKKKIILLSNPVMFENKAPCSVPPQGSTAPSKTPSPTSPQQATNKDIKAGSDKNKR